MFLELANYINELCKNIENGILVVFPSYNLMN